MWEAEDDGWDAKTAVSRETLVMDEAPAADVAVISYMSSLATIHHMPRRTMNCSTYTLLHICNYIPALNLPQNGILVISKLKLPYCVTEKNYNDLYSFLVTTWTISLLNDTNIVCLESKLYIVP